MSSVTIGDYFSWRFAVDFAGGELAALAKSTEVEPVVSVSRGTIETPSARPLQSLGGFRAMFDVKPPDASVEPIDIRLFLRHRHQPLTETWMYQWTPPPPRSSRRADSSHGERESDYSLCVESSRLVSVLEMPSMQPDAAEHAIERFETVGAQLGDDVPATVRAVERADRRIAAQGLEHRFGLVALDGDRHQRANALLFDLRPQPHGVAHDGAVGLELGEPVLNGAAGHAQLLGERRDRDPGVLPQQRDQLAVDVVHRAASIDLIKTPAKADILLNYALILISFLAIH